MSDSPQDRAAALERALQAVKDQGPQAATSALQYLMQQPTQRAADDLWRIVTLGLLGLLAVALVGTIIVVLHGGPTDVMLTVFSALLTGTLGLFTLSSSVLMPLRP